MRFHGMVGDHVTISPSAQAWRPPEYITAPTRHVTSRPTDHPESTHQIPPSRTTSPSPKPPQTKKNKSIQHLRTVPPYKCLPIPTTCVNPSRRRFRPYLTTPQRLLAFIVAIFAASSLLVTLTSVFSRKLDQVSSTVKAQQRMRAPYPPSHISPPVIPLNSTNHFRRLLAVEGNALPHGVQALLPADIIVKAFSALLTSAQAIHGIMTTLLERQFLPLMPTASILLNSPFLPNSPSKPSKPSARNNDLEHRLRSLHGELLDMYREVIFKKATTPVKSPSTSSAFNGLSSEADSTKKSGERSNSIPDLHAAVTNDIGKRVGQAQSPRSSNVLYPQALSVVGNVPLSKGHSRYDLSSKRSMNNIGKDVGPGSVLRQTSKGPRNAQKHVDNTKTSFPPGNRQTSDSPSLPGHASGRRAQQTYPLSGFKHPRGPTVPQAIYYWQLPGGKSLCRIFNVGYLSDGTLVVPKWMKKYQQFLLTRCGTKDLIFATENKPGGFAATLDRHALNAHGVSHIEIDRSNAERDLVGTSVPRDHMPHFVTDIFFHLVACEVLLGSGKQLLRAEFLFPPRGSATESASSSSIIQDLEPSMFLSDETWNRPHTEWVPRLAQFFRHPSLDFTFLRWKGSKKAKDASRPHKTVISSFRSLVIGNLQNHEPYGMFGANGTNIVFDANGVTRAPTWRRSVAGDPCRLTVTVLNRKGPRALLRLSELQQRLNYLWKKEASMLIDFKVVDFSRKSFDDQVRIMQETNVLIATHGAGNANFIFLRPSATVIEVFPFAYKAGPFDRFAAIFGLDYKTAMSAPQTDVFKECMNRHETNQRIKKLVFSWWDKAVKEEKMRPWVHRLELEKEIGEPGKSEGMTTRGCVRLQELEFDIDAVSRMVLDSGRAQCVGPNGSIAQGQQPFTFSVHDSLKGSTRHP